MTTIVLGIDEAGVVRELRALGHSGYAQSGEDIVCAAISVLTINLVNSIEKFTKDRFTCEITEDSGDFSFQILGEMSEFSILLMKSCILGLENIAKEYGTEFITIKHENIDSSRR